MVLPTVMVLAPEGVPKYALLMTFPVAVIVQALPMTVPIWSCTFALPAPTAVTFPVPSTVNKAGFEDDQITCEAGMAVGVELVP
jgi:hypothetical protein